MPKKRPGTRVGVATPTHDNVTTSYDNTTPTPSQRAAYELFRRLSVLSTPRQIVLQLMTRLSRLEDEIVMFLKELAKYPEIAAQIEEFRDRAEDLYGLYYRYFYFFYPTSPSSIEEMDDIVSHCRLKPTASCRHGADERLAPLRARPEPNLLGGSLSLPDKIITQPKERRIPLSPKGDSPLRPFSMADGESMVMEFIDELVALESEWKKFVEENRLWIAFL